VLDLTDGYVAVVAQAIVNETREYFVESRDMFGNTRWNGGDSYTAFLLDPDDVRGGEQTWLVALSPQLEDYGNGTYRMSYRSSVQGYFLLNVALSKAGFDLPETIGSCALVDASMSGG
jgi:hypothetical protein